MPKRCRNAFAMRNTSSPPFPEFRFCGCQNARVARNLLPASHPLEGLLLEKAQELHLHRPRQFPGFVQKQRAAGGRLVMPYCTAVEHITCRFVARKDQRKTISVRQADSSAVCCQSLVRGQQDEFLELRLRD